MEGSETKQLRQIEHLQAVCLSQEADLYRQREAIVVMRNFIHELRDTIVADPKNRIALEQYLALTAKYFSPKN